MIYELELQKVIDTITLEKAVLVCLQLPDGLKPKAKEIQDFIESKTNSQVIIWAGTCFGGCDIPDLDKFKVDLLIQWGHSVFRKTF